MRERTLRIGSLMRVRCGRLILGTRPSPEPFVVTVDRPRRPGVVCKATAFLRGAAVAGALLTSACTDGSSPDSQARSPAPSTPIASGADPAPDIVADSPLVRIAKAERETVFSGWKTATSGPEGGRQTRMKVARLADGRTYMAWEQEGRQAMRWVYRSRHRWIDDPSLLAANYEVVDVSDDEAPIAWRPVRRLEVRSRNAGRPSMTLIVDRDTWLVLGEEIRDFEGVRRFAWHFDTIEFDPAEVPGEWPAAKSVVVTEDGRTNGSAGSGDPVASRASGSSGKPGSEIAADADAGADAADSPAPRALHADALPEGFVLVDRKPAHDGGVAAYYSDGLAAFVIRQRAVPITSAPARREGELSRQACSGRSEVSAVFEGIEVSILGNLPLPELEAIAASLRVGP